ncbi:TetR/AcrR family transcriptional regulator [Microbacterium sp. G2-8]|uniref:TetR/AcrR family transcriptional regulator n=1 Tax=Microbacterium sp. G2-8 TaxID=2842454 RepID=UPI001C8A8FEA|nr:TetR/AcrR family transcriptional regulator [Microbacterium sp. G2-8]
MPSARQSPSPNRGPAAAAGNRRALIDAARELFAEEGFSVAFSAIAKRAGVGQASLYRHFESKERLALAVFDKNLADLEADPSLTLHDFLMRIAAQARMSASVLEAHALDPELAAPLQERLRGVITRILETELATERADPSVTVDDVVTATSMVAFHTAFAGDGDAAVALVERALTR